MALKGSYPLCGGAVILPEAYAVIDEVHVTKGGHANCHVSIYPTPPKTVTRTAQKLNDEQIVETYEYQDIDRGQVVEHFSSVGIDTKGGDPFVAAYNQIQKVLADSGDERLKDMKSA